MIHNLEDKSKKELIEIAKIQIDEHQKMIKRIAELEQAIISNCYDDPSTSGKRLMALVMEQVK